VSRDARYYQHDKVIEIDYKIKNLLACQVTSRDQLEVKPSRRTSFRANLGYYIVWQSSEDCRPGHTSSIVCLLGVRANTPSSRRSNIFMENGAISLDCPCGRSFPIQGALTKHQKSCQKTRKRLAGALDTAKTMWTIRKRLRHDSGHQHTALTEGQPSSSMPGLILTPSQTEDMSEQEVRPNPMTHKYSTPTGLHS